jgi:outer membrane immunogenic protein
MKKVMLGAVALAAIGAAPVLAADLPARTYTKAPPVVAPVNNWTGCHVGVNAGGGWSNESFATSTPPTGATGAPNTLATGPFDGSQNNGWGTSARTSNNGGFAGGGQVGCDYQTGIFVFGGEADIQGFTAKANSTTSFATLGAPTIAVSNAFSSQTPWFGTVRGRIGTTAFNPAVLVYATGGFAYGGENITDNMRVTNAAGTVVEQFPFSTSSTKTGWTVGGGLEWMFAHSWSIRAEYLYVQLDANGGQVLNTAVLGPSALATDAMRLDTGRDKLNIVRVGLDYKFDWAGPVVARY